MCNPKVVSLASCSVWNELFTFCDNDQLWKELPTFQNSCESFDNFEKLELSKIDMDLSETLSHKLNSKKVMSVTAVRYRRHYRDRDHNYEILEELPSPFRFNPHSIQSAYYKLWNSHDWKIKFIGKSSKHLQSIVANRLATITVFQTWTKSCF